MTDDAFDHLVPYLIGSQEIWLPPDHCLPSFQKEHKLYDRFIPVLCRALDGDEYIIDVGANVGDSVCAILQSCSNPVICVEGHERYFGILQKNLKAMRGGDRVKALYTLAGTGRFSGSLLDDGTSARLLQSDTHQSTRALDDILSELDISSRNVCLLKLDTDGYDADVIHSAESTVKGSEPLLFWENYFSNDDQLQMLDELYNMLNAWNYAKLWVFDNFGNLLLSECDFRQLRDVNRYINSQNRGNATRTIWYTDVFASTERRYAAGRSAIDTYRHTIINSSS